jgi:DNA repair protein RadC
VEIDESRPGQIKNWSPDERPREKLLLKGPSSLADVELLAILIGSGTQALSAVDLARKILHAAEGSLHALAKWSARDLMRIKGIGEAKAVSIMAALELGRRRNYLDPGERPKVGTSQDAFSQVKSDLMDLSHEEFWVLLLNRANRIVRKRRISEGGVSGTVADPKIIYKMALEELASGIIVAHNHPSGNLTASQNDIDLTRKLKEAGKFLEIRLLDHLIIAGNKYYSFADDGIL